MGVYTYTHVYLSRGLLPFLFFFLFGHTCSMRTFLGQGWNLSHSSDQSRSSENARSLTPGATRELPFLPVLIVFLYIQLLCCFLDTSLHQFYFLHKQDLYHYIDLLFFPRQRFYPKSHVRVNGALVFSFSFHLPGFIVCILSGVFYRLTFPFLLFLAYFWINFCSSPLFLIICLLFL